MRFARHHRPGFTLIELLIVVAIIAILAAIAVPNFLEAQTRSKVSRAASDMRTIVTGIEAYIVDWNKEPRVDSPLAVPAGQFSAWWGFVPTAITTPVAYLTSRPAMPFLDREVTNFWEALGGTEQTQTYTIVRDAWTPALAPAWQPGRTNARFPGVVIDAAFNNKARQCAYFLYTAGPDAQDSTVWGSPMLYDATNGTVSFGDVYRFGSGTPKGSANEERQ